MRSNCDADHRQQLKNNSAASGTITSRTKPEGQSAIDSSNVAIASVTSETVTAAKTPVRIDATAGVMPGVVMSVADPVIEPSPRFAGLTPKGAVNQTHPNNSPTGRSAATAGLWALRG